MIHLSSFPIINCETTGHVSTGPVEPGGLLVELEAAADPGSWIMEKINEMIDQII